MVSIYSLVFAELRDVGFTLVPLFNGNKGEPPGKVGLNIVFQREPPEIHLRTLFEKTNQITDRRYPREVRMGSLRRL